MAIEKVLECMPQMVVRCDDKGSIIYANTKWTTYCGKRSVGEEELWLSVVHPTEEKETKEKWEQHVMRDVPFEITHRLRSSNGEYKWYRSTSSRYDGNTDYLLTSTDVHTEITITHALHESFSRGEAFERRIIHNTDPIITVNANDSTIMRVNNAVKTHFQYSPEELLGKLCTVLMEDKTGSRHLGEGGYFEKFKRHLSKGHTLSNTSIGFSRQINARRKDGKLIPVSFVLDSYVQANLQVYIVVLRPINPEITMQQEINKSKDAFLSTISHELRTPLFGLLGTISLLHSQIMDPTTLEDVTQMEINVMSLLSIVNNMIDFYLLNQLNTVPVYLPFDTSKLVVDICERMSGFRHTGVNFTYETDAPPLLVSDPNFIEHVLVNLLSNALRFTPTGKVEVKVCLTDPTQAEQESSISLLPGQGVLQLTVTDTGIGIEPEFYPQLFQPFTQIDNSDQRAYKGVGLGLAITKSVVDMLGGGISFTSSPGNGSEFHVLIPVELIQLPGTRPSSCEPLPQHNFLNVNDDISQFDLAPPKPGQPRKRRLSSPLLSQFLHPEDNFTFTRKFALPTILSPSLNQTPNCPFSAMMNSKDSNPHPLPATASQSFSELSLSVPDSPPKTLRKFPSSPSLHTHEKPTFLIPPSASSSLDRPKSPQPTFLAPPSSSSSSSTSSSPSPTLSERPKSPQNQKRVDGTSSQQIGALNKRILVVEDNSMNQLVIKRMLQRLECEVVLAKHGGEALEILFDTESDRYQTFDTVLADCQMPIMDGYQVTEHIRHWEALQRGSPHMLVLALSASISADNEAKCLESGMDGFIAKPVTVLMLYHYLASYYSLVDMQTIASAAKVE